MRIKKILQKSASQSSHEILLQKHFRAYQHILHITHTTRLHTLQTHTCAGQEPAAVRFLLGFFHHRLRWGHQRHCDQEAAVRLRAGVFLCVEVAATGVYVWGGGGGTVEENIVCTCTGECVLETGVLTHAGRILGWWSEARVWTGDWEAAGGKQPQGVCGWGWPWIWMVYTWHCLPAGDTLQVRAIMNIPGHPYIWAASWCEEVPSACKHGA